MLKNITIEFLSVVISWLDSSLRIFLNLVKTLSVALILFITGYMTAQAQPNFGYIDPVQTRTLLSNHTISSVGAVSGRVTDDDNGLGVAYVEVVTESGDFSTSTDLQGYYRLEGLPVGRTTLHFRIGAYLNHQRQVSITPAGDTTSNVVTNFNPSRDQSENISLETGVAVPDSNNPAILSGRVRDAVTRGNLSMSRNQRGYGSSFRVQAINDRYFADDDLSGRYQIVLNPGRKRIEVSGFGYITTSVWIDLEPGARITQDFYLPPKPAKIEGTVNQNLAGARVQIGSRSTITDATGHFRIEGLPAHENLTVRVTKEGNAGYRETQASIKMLPGEERLDYYLVLETRSSIPRNFSGVVKDQQSGRPLAGVMVVASNATRTRACTDANGRFTFRNLNRSVGHFMDFYQDGYAPERGLQVSLSGGEENLFVSFESTPNVFSAEVLLPRQQDYRVPAGYDCATTPPDPEEAIDSTSSRYEDLHGRVTDAGSGSPLPGVAVVFMDQRACTDAGGNYRIRHIPVNMSAYMTFNHVGYREYRKSQVIGVAHVAQNGVSAEDLNEVSVALQTDSSSNADSSANTCQEIVRQSRSIAEADAYAPVIQGIEILLVDSATSQPIKDARLEDRIRHTSGCTNSAGRVRFTENISANNGYHAGSRYTFTAEKKGYRSQVVETYARGDINENRYLFSMIADPSNTDARDCGFRAVELDDKNKGSNALRRIAGSTAVATEQLVRTAQKTSTKSNPKLIKNKQRKNSGRSGKVPSLQESKLQLKKTTGLTKEKTLPSFGKSVRSLQTGNKKLPKLAGFSKKSSTMGLTKKQPKNTKSKLAITTPAVNKKTKNPVKEFGEAKAVGLSGKSSKHVMRQTSSSARKQLTLSKPSAQKKAGSINKKQATGLKASQSIELSTKMKSLPPAGRASSVKSVKVKGINIAGKKNATAKPVVLPDLLIKEARLSTATLFPGQTFKFWASGYNSSSGAAKTVNLLLLSSTDSNISTADKVLKSLNRKSLSRGKKISYQLEQTAPKKPGAYYYGACIKSRSKEKNIKNNCSKPLKLTVKKKPLTKSSSKPAVKTSKLGKKNPVNISVKKQKTAEDKIQK